jgi:CheY-like chemotaxis protein
MEMLKIKDVLVVDDDDATRDLICKALELIGLTCDHAGNGRAALDLLRIGDYPVVLLDMQMPILDGAGVLQELQEWRQPEHRKPVILIITGFPERESAPISGDVAQAIIRKPFEVDDLVGLVGGCVAARMSGLAHQVR